MASTILLLLVASQCMHLIHGANSTVSRQTFIKNKINNFNSWISPSLRTEKYTAMDTDVFAFYRGTNHLFYDDINTRTIPIDTAWPGTSNIKTWVQGDLHSENVGFFNNKLGDITLDVNDFDETFVAPFYYDCIRMCAAIHLMRDVVTGFTLTQTEATDTANQFLTTYQSVLELVNGNPGELTNIMKGSVLGAKGTFTRDVYEKLQNNADYQITTSSFGIKTPMGKYTIISGGQHIFDFANPDLAACTTLEISNIASSWAAYKTSLDLTFFGSKPSTYWNIKTQAARLHSGLGSLGVKKYYVIMEGPTSSNYDDILLEMKESRKPTMIQLSAADVTLYTTTYGTTHGKRAMVSGYNLLNYADQHSGHTTIGTTSYSIRNQTPQKYKVSYPDFTSKTNLQDFINNAARALAHSHARADNDGSSGLITYNAEAGIVNAIKNVWTSAKTKIELYGRDYADQVRVDWGMYKTLRTSVPPLIV